MAYGMGYGLAKMAEGLTGGALQGQRDAERKRDKFVQETLSLASIMDPEYAQKFVDRRLPDYGIRLKRPELKPQNVSIQLPSGETIEGERAKISDLMGRLAQSGKTLSDPDVLKLAAANGVNVARLTPKDSKPELRYDNGQIIDMMKGTAKPVAGYTRPPRQPTAEEIKYSIYKKDPDYFKKTGGGGDKPPTPKQAIDEIGQAMNAIAKATGQEISAIDKTMMAIDPQYAERLKAMTNSPEAKAKIDNAKAAIQYYSQFLPPGYDRGGIDAVMGQAPPGGGGAGGKTPDPLGIR
jgi:hypothetical protein